MEWTKWLVVVFVLIAGIDLAFPTTLDSFKTAYSIGGFTLGNILGYVAIVVGLWTVYEMTMKK